MPSRLGRIAMAVVGPVIMALGIPSAQAAGEEIKRWQVNMEPGVTEMGARIYDLHMTVFWICVVIGVVVFAVMFYSIYAHRKSRGVTPSTFHESTKVEVAWTVVPFLILVGMAVPSTTTMIDLYNTEDAELDVLITGYQWKWKYEYLNDEGENVSFFSNLKTPQTEIYNQDVKNTNYLLEVDEPLVLPVGKKVRFLVTANDVIHAWWVPQLAVKKDAIPGFINETWTLATEEGTYRGQCAELCGKDHGFMPIVVNVVSEPEFNDWMAEKQAAAAELNALMSQEMSLDELMERGEAVYQRACAACHGPNGEGGVGKAIVGSAYALGPVADHLDIIVNGSASNAMMQAFGKQLNDVDLAAVTTYQRNGFGNNMGDLVQPVDVYNFKQGQ